VFDATSFSEPATSRAVDLLADWGAPAPMLVLLADDEVAAGKSFRNLPDLEAMPVQDAGVADIVGAASLLISEAALPSLVARAGASGENGDARSESEEAA
jgi:large subunit ribosomal protein L4